MTGWLTVSVTELFGGEATAEESYGTLTVDVPPASWVTALRTARSTLGCTYFDWLSAVDEPDGGFRVSAHVVALGPVRRLLLRTTVSHEAPVLASAVEVYAGAAWHERETHEMFGIDFAGHPHLVPLLLPEGFEGHPLRKDFVLAARVVKAWPGAKEPGESGHGGPRQRQMLPPGVPDPNEWGPLKGTLPAVPARPGRPARAAGGADRERPAASPGRAAQGGARAAADRPARRMRTAGEGSASQRTGAAGPPGTTHDRDRTPPVETRGSAGGTVDVGNAARRGAEAAASERALKAEADAPGRALENDDSRPAAQDAVSDHIPQAHDVGRGTRGTRATQGDDSVRRTQGRAAPGEPEDAASRPVSQRESRHTGRCAADQPAPAASASDPRCGPRSADAPWHHARPEAGEPRTARTGGRDTDRDSQGGQGAHGAHDDPDAPPDDDSAGGSP